VTGLGSRNAPLLSVEQWNLCPGLFGTVPRPIPVDCITTFITVQIPTGISYTTAPFYIYSRIVISDNGVDSQPFGIDVIPDQKHILTECDISGPSSICPAIVTHADGTMVSTRSPAAPGEVVVIYGWGFGETTPPVQTGEMAPAPAPVVRTLFTAVGFDFSPNAAPKSYIEGPSVPVTVYLTSGQVGLYQINVQLPLTFPAVRPCSRDGLFPSSNLTINVRGLWSFDGAPICVEATP
jgi:uncharacterized protein (TIGR03437 family)